MAKKHVPDPEPEPNPDEHVTLYWMDGEGAVVVDREIEISKRFAQYLAKRRMAYPTLSTNPHLMSWTYEEDVIPEAGYGHRYLPLGSYLLNCGVNLTPVYEEWFEHEYGETKTRRKGPSKAP